MLLLPRNGARVCPFHLLARPLTCDLQLAMAMVGCWQVSAGSTGERAWRPVSVVSAGACESSHGAARAHERRVLAAGRIVNELLDDDELMRSPGEAAGGTVVAAAGGSGVVVVSASATTLATASLTGSSSQSVPGDCDKQQQHR
jgi:hypothetical protein